MLCHSSHVKHSNRNFCSLLLSFRLSLRLQLLEVGPDLCGTVAFWEIAAITLIETVPAAGCIFIMSSCKARLQWVRTNEDALPCGNDGQSGGLLHLLTERVCFLQAQGSHYWLPGERIDQTRHRGNGLIICTWTLSRKNLQTQQTLNGWKLCVLTAVSIL